MFRNLHSHRWHSLLRSRIDAFCHPSCSDHEWGVGSGRGGGGGGDDGRVGEEERERQTNSVTLVFLLFSAFLYSEF